MKRCHPSIWTEGQRLCQINCSPGEGVPFPRQNSIARQLQNVSSGSYPKRIWAGRQQAVAALCLKIFCFIYDTHAAFSRYVFSTSAVHRANLETLHTKLAIYHLSGNIRDGGRVQVAHCCEGQQISLALSKAARFLLVVQARPFPLPPRLAGSRSCTLCIRFLPPYAGNCHPSPFQSTGQLPSPVNTSRTLHAGSSYH